MNAASAMGLLRGLRAPVVTTADVAALLGLEPKTASKTLERLAGAGLVRRLCRGWWSLEDAVDPYQVAAYLNSPFPAYVSLQSALYLHGMIEQVPGMIYLVTLGRSRRIKTTAARYSAHHVAPEFFGGFEVREPRGIPLATPEKALMDVLYLSGTRTRVFAALPELEFPPGFRWSAAKSWIERIRSRRIAAMVRRRLDEVRGRIASAKRAG